MKRSRRLLTNLETMEQRRAAARTPSVGQAGSDARHPDGRGDRGAGHLQRRARRQPDAERRGDQRAVAPACITPSTWCAASCGPPITGFR